MVIRLPGLSLESRIRHVHQLHFVEIVSPNARFSILSNRLEWVTGDYNDISGTQQGILQFAMHNALRNTRIVDEPHQRQRRMHNYSNVQWKICLHMLEIKY